VELRLGETSKLKRTITKARGVNRYFARDGGELEKFGSETSFRKALGWLGNKDLVYILNPMAWRELIGERGRPLQEMLLRLLGGADHEAAVTALMKAKGYEGGELNGTEKKATVLRTAAKKALTKAKATLTERGRRVTRIEADIEAAKEAPAASVGEAPPIPQGDVNATRIALKDAWKKMDEASKVLGRAERALEELDKQIERQAKRPPWGKVHGEKDDGYIKTPDGMVISADKVQLYVDALGSMNTSIPFDVIDWLRAQDPTLPEKRETAAAALAEAKARDEKATAYHADRETAHEALQAQHNVMNNWRAAQKAASGAVVQTLTESLAAAKAGAASSKTTVGIATKAVERAEALVEAVRKAPGAALKAKLADLDTGPVSFRFGGDKLDLEVLVDGRPWWLASGGEEVHADACFRNALRIACKRPYMTMIVDDARAWTGAWPKWSGQTILLETYTEEELAKLAELEELAKAATTEGT